ncbi:hypothetical protein EV359DRAFT_49199, partial [Lentinula novae-zelandiae]
WEVDIPGGFIKSTVCEPQTHNSDAVCNPCRAISKDESFKRSVRRKNHEAGLSQEEWLKKSRFREIHSSLTTNCLQKIERRHMKDLLDDKILFDINDLLKTNDPHDCFLRLWSHAKEGNLGKHERVVEICASLEDRVRRESSDNPKLKYGIRYAQNVINYMMLMRGYGHNSHQQYTIFTSPFGGPSSRQLQTLRSRSVDALQNPYLVFENMARVKQYYDSLKYSGPVIAASDCTKVKKRLNFSVQFGCHILGTMMSLQEVEVDSVEDIDEIVEQAVKGGSLATQVCAVMIKVPIPQSPPIVVALLPTAGKEDASDIHALHMRLITMAGQLNLPILAMAADDAAAELAVQSLMDQEQTELPPLVYENLPYGIRLSVPVFKSGPLISVTDAPHAQKTACNQPQHGTHTASLGTGYLVNRSLIDIYSLNGELRDVDNVDKQDDGAACRVFHFNVLQSMTETEDAQTKIQAGFEDPFYYPGVPVHFHLISTEWVEHFFGVAREMLPNFSYAKFLKMVQHIMLRQRILELALVSYKCSKDSASGYLFNEISDLRTSESNSVPPVNISRSRLNILVSMAYNGAVHLCRDILMIPAHQKPSFTKQPLLHITSEDEGGGHDIDSDDEANELLAIDDDEDAADTHERFNCIAGITAKDTAKYSTLCTDLEYIISKNKFHNTDIGIPLPCATSLIPIQSDLVLSQPVSLSVIEFSKLLDRNTSKISIAACVKERQLWQSATATKSKCTVRLSDKYDLGKVLASTHEQIKRISPKEASHRLCIAQDLNADLQSQQKKNWRQKQWLEVAKNIEKVFASPEGKKVPFIIHCLVLIKFLSLSITESWVKKCPQSVSTRAEQFCDHANSETVYKKAQSSHYGSLPKATDLSGLSYLSLRVYLPLGVPVVSFS